MALDDTRYTEAGHPYSLTRLDALLHGAMFCVTQYGLTIACTRIESGWIVSYRDDATPAKSITEGPVSAELAAAMVWQAIQRRRHAA